MILYTLYIYLVRELSILKFFYKYNLSVKLTTSL